jgi:hypothetical protein
MGRRRRQFLAAVGGTVTGVFTGCVESLTRASCDALKPGASATNYREELSLPVPESELIKAANRDEIRAITETSFASDWSDRAETLEEYTFGGLVAEDIVIGVTREGRSRAYPLQILWTHEIVNDDFGGPLLVTYCPICGSSVTAERTVDGAATIFGVSGYLWRSDLVMYDRRTESLWSQIAATAIRGSRTGQELTLVPSTVTTWESWRQSNPGTDVLLPPPLSTAISESVAKPSYVPYRRKELFSDRGTDEFDNRTAVKGVVVDGTARAYPFPVVEREGLLNDRVGGHPVLVGLGTGTRLVAYDRCVDGQALTFEATEEGMARAGGSRWRLDTGLAVDGPHDGERLTELGGQPMFWFAWQKFNPDSDVYGVDQPATSER